MPRDVGVSSAPGPVTLSDRSVMDGVADTPGGAPLVLVGLLPTPPAADRPTIFAQEQLITDR